MPNIKKWNLISKNKIKLKLTVYLISFFIFPLLLYVSVPKLLDFSLESIKENLKKNNNISINNISKVDYKIFPTPRLSLSNSNFTIGKKIVEVSNSELEIILDLRKILSSKKIYYKKLLINNGSSKINLNNINNFLTTADKNIKEINFNKNSLIFLQENKVFLKISDASIQIQHASNKKQLNINGNFLNNKIFIKFDNTLKNKNNLSLEIPGLDILTEIFLEKNNFGEINGFLNLEVHNNFLKFNFIKEDGVKIKNGFIRSKIVNSSLEGKIIFKPNFFLLLNFKPSNLNIEKLLLVVKKNYFSDDINNLSLIKKINGIFNFNSTFKGKITNRNGEILLENFQVGSNQPLFFSAKIAEFGKKGKVYFNLAKIVKHKKGLFKKIEIIGFLIPSNSKVVFQKFVLDGRELSTKETEVHQNKFIDDVVRGSLSNIFNEGKINKFLKNSF